MVVTRVELAGRSYDVHVGPGLLGDMLGEKASAMLRKSRVPVVTDSNAHRFWGAQVAETLAAQGIEAQFLIHEPGEGAKSWHGLEKTVEFFLAEEIERGDFVIALGGGVIGDLTGFAASMVKRGCGFIQLPTTLLSQVDSSVGGKTAINTTTGKNLVGAFHQPSLVLADTDTLSTLATRELRCGYAEVIKYGILGDAAFFDWCEANGEQVIARDPEALSYAVSASVEAKARIVAEDEHETSGARALLNLGHTFGHALEAQTGFGDRLLHGEAVALGMVLAARFSARRRYISDNVAERIADGIGAVGLATEIATLGLNCSGQTLAAHMLHDKKMDAGTLPFVLLRGIGEAFLDREVSLVNVGEFLEIELQGG